MWIYLQKLKNILINAGLSDDEFEIASHDFLRLNVANLRIFAAVMSVYCASLFFTSFFNGVSSLNRNTYLITFLFGTIIMILTFIKQLNTRTVITSLVYVFIATVFWFGISVGLTQPSQISASFLVLIVAAPLFFYDRPFRIGILIVIFSIIFILLSLRYKSPDVYETDVINGIVYCTLSVVLTTRNLVVRTENVWYDRKMQIIAEIDILTQLKNRNCFEHSCMNYVKRAKKNVVCIFADINGLHELNNTKGHKAGDELLKFIANEFQNEFGKDDTYRVGGDEYVVMLCDKDEEFVREKINRIMKIMEAKKHHISVGIASEPIKGIDIDLLIKRADERMYEAKALYYQQKGIDRRKC